MSYYNGQIVFNLDTQKPIKVGSGSSTFAWENIPKRTTHFIRLVHGGTEIALPTTVKEAKELLIQNKITPALINTKDHCWCCRNWLSNPKAKWCKNEEHK